MFISDYLKALEGRQIMHKGSKGDKGPYTITCVDRRGISYDLDGTEAIIPWNSEASWKLYELVEQNLDAP